jgi:uncharacterized protein (DUF342 family)
MNQAGERPWMTIGSERVTAQVRVPGGVFVNLATLRDLLRSLGVLYGTDAQALCALSHLDLKERFVVVASGHLPPDLIDRQLQLNPSVKVPMTVAKGDSLGRLSGEGPFLGHAVDGQSLWPKWPSVCGHGLLLSEDGVVLCQCAGTLQRDAQGTLSIELASPITVMTSVELRFNLERTTLHITIPAWHYLPMIILQQALIQAKVVRGIHNNIMIDASVAHATVRVLEVASGIPTRHGVDGRVEMLIDEHIHLRVEGNGRVDYREHGRIEDVNGGAALGRILPPTTGVHGVDVHGAYLEARPGRTLNPAQVIGEGAELDAQHPDIIRAVATGHFHRDRIGRLCVQGRYVVDEHVDYHHGNIQTKLSVAIKGDIRAGFTVKSEGDIEVMGVIEDARVTAQGNLVVRGGILPGSNRVKAHGDIDAKHVASRQLKCKELRVTNSLRWSHVMAVGDIIAKEILGGNLTAGGNITCDVLGNSDGLHTRLQAGLDPYTAELFACAQREHEAIVTAVREQKARCKTIGLDVQAQRIEVAEWNAALSEFSAACHRLATCEALIERADIQHKRNTQTPCSAVIQVNNMAYRGTEIWLSERAHIVLDKDLARPRFYDKDGTVAWS